jgi:pantoate--beta-alanine ligase
MVADLHLGVQVVGVSTVRDADGLALSSRNVHLDATERLAAATLPAALSAGVQAGVHGPEAVLAAASDVLATQDVLVLDYLALRDPALGGSPRRGPARLLLAATVGTTRLIDNVGLHLGVPDVAPEVVPAANGRGGL